MLKLGEGGEVYLGEVLLLAQGEGTEEVKWDLLSLLSELEKLRSGKWGETRLNYAKSS